MELLVNYELLELLKEYHNKGLLADDNFIKRALIILLKDHKGLVKEIYVGDDCYLFDKPLFLKEDKTVYFKSILNSNSLFLNNTLSIEDKIDLYNIEVLRKIFELYFDVIRHSYKNEGYAEKLFLMEDEFKSINVSPTQRIIQLDAIKRAQNIAGWINFNDVDTIINYFAFENAKALLDGYQQSPKFGPVYAYKLEYNEYLKCMGRFFACDADVASNLEKEAFQHTEEENFYYGLPVREDTFNLVNSKLENSKLVLERKRN